MKKIIYSFRAVFLFCFSIGYGTSFSQSCGDPYTPQSFTPIKTVRINLNFLQTSDGAIGFDKNNPLHMQAFTKGIELLNNSFSNIPTFASGDPCFNPLAVTDSRIRFQIGTIRNIPNSKYFWYSGGTNEVCPESDTWYLKHLNDSLNENENETGINIYFPNNLCMYNNALTPGTSEKPVCIGFFGAACTVLPKSNINFNSPIVSPNLYSDYLWKKNHIDILKATSFYGNPPNPNLYWSESTGFNDGNNVYVWFLRDLMVVNHELGHVLGLQHDKSCNAMMNGDVVGSYLSPNELATCHKSLEYLNVKKYIIENPTIHDHSIYDNTKNAVINTGETKTWQNSVRIKGNLIVRSGANLTITCKTIMAGNAQIIVESGGILNIIGEGQIVVNCYSNSQVLTYNIAPTGRLNVSNRGSLHINSQTRYNVSGIVTVFPSGQFCQQDNAQFNIQSGGQVSVPAYKNGTDLVYNNELVTNVTGIAINTISISNTIITPTTDIYFIAENSITFNPKTEINASVNNSFETLSDVYFGNCTSFETCISLRKAESTDMSQELFLKEINSESDGTQKIFIFPNPISSGQVNFGQITSHFVLISSTGAIVKEGFNSDKVDITGLNKGIYMIKLDNQNEKLIIE